MLNCLQTFALDFRAKNERSCLHIDRNRENGEVELDKNKTTKCVSITLISIYSAVSVETKWNNNRN